MVDFDVAVDAELSGLGQDAKFKLVLVVYHIRHAIMITAP